MISYLTYLQDIDNFPIYKYLLIFLISFLSNMFSAISGGGAGLVQLPALILLGIPYYQALASHKVATVALGIGGSIRNHNSLRNNFSIILKILVFGTPGVVVGSSLVGFLSEEFLYLILGLLSIFLALYSLLKPSLGLFSVDKKVSFYKQVRFIVLIFLIGILNGSVSSGTGLLVTILLIRTFELDFLRAVSLTFFTVGIFWNASGAVILSKIGTVPINILFVLILGAFCGGFFGAHLSNLKGNKLIKSTFTIVCLLVGISLLIKSIG